MTAHCWIQTLKGNAIELTSTMPGTIDLMGEVPEVLARIPRFNGHVPAGAYSVAQHLVLGAEAILRDRAERDRGAIQLARAFLLHDVHEYAIGDIATPVAEALAVRAGAFIASRMVAAPETASKLGEMAFKAALSGLKADLDAEIYRAAGMQWPLPPEIAARVRKWDLRMLAAERRHLMAKPPKPWAPVVEAAEPAPLRGRIKILSWPEAAEQWRAMARQLFPNLTEEGR